jgi:hypothetical protein
MFVSPEYNYSISGILEERDALGFSRPNSSTVDDAVTAPTRA